MTQNPGAGHIVAMGGLVRQPARSADLAFVATPWNR
jgi:hypothetical protein